MVSARSIRVQGVVQGVGFRPFVYRLARANSLSGWVRNHGQGVEIHLEGGDAVLEAFIRDLRAQPPPGARITAIEVAPAESSGLRTFTIQSSGGTGRPTTRISPDLPVCADCLRELFDPLDRRYGYPYINCTHCGPRYTVLERLPYDRPNTTMRHWPLDPPCAAEYRDPADRRFHAQPVACPRCGPHYYWAAGGERIDGDSAAIRRAAACLRQGGILAVKGLGGYHLACDARNAGAVAALRSRKFRKEKPFALMARDVEAARKLVRLSGEALALLESAARPIVLAPAVAELPEVAPGAAELGVMLPYTPVQHLLFAAGAPDALVMTSGNRSSEPIASGDEEALERLDGIADGFLVGERPIAVRMDDSVARAGAFGPAILRRARGYAPSAAAVIPCSGPLLAAGADLKNTVTLVVAGQAFVSQHIGDLEHYEARKAFRQAARSLLGLYEAGSGDLLVAHDLHPQYVSTAAALEIPAARHAAVQHHKAHIASVLAEREAWTAHVLGVGFDGTGYGDDGAIWGGEFFTGSLAEGFARVGHLRPAVLPGGDAAARHPIQSAAGFLAGLGNAGFEGAPFHFPPRFEQARRMALSGTRTFQTTSAGRLFDAAAALLGFTRQISFEGQAAMWLEQLARRSAESAAYPFPWENGLLDWRPLLDALAADRRRGRVPEASARAFQRGFAAGLSRAILSFGIEPVVLSGGVFQNELLLEDLKRLLAPSRVRVWTNHIVPANDGGISLGQAAIAAFAAGAAHA